MDTSHIVHNLYSILDSVLWVFYGCFMGVLWAFYGCFMGSAIYFNEYFFHIHIF